MKQNKQLPAGVQERIKADAASMYPLTNGNDLETGKRIGYIAGATAVHERAQEKEKIFEDLIQRISNIASWSDDPYKSTLMRVAATAQEQWKGREVEKFTEEDAEYMRSCDLHPLLDGAAIIMTEDSEGVRLNKEDLSRLALTIKKYITQ